MKGTLDRPICRGCQKPPSEIKEYQHHKDPVHWVLMNERLIGKSFNFYCTTCYVKAGLPLY